MEIQPIVLSANRFPAFNPMQEKCLAAGFLDRNSVIATPTASGKTILAELSSLHQILNEHRKVIYTCPLRALAREHYSDFKKKYGQLHKIRFAISTGDYDSASQYLSGYDMIFSTVEKLESLLRHKADWLSSVGLLIVDEVHLLGTDRGPTLEMAITKLKTVNPKIRVLALSATIPNSQEIAEWLGAKLVQSDYRPVPLSEGVFFDSEIRFDKKIEAISSDEREPITAIVHDTLHQKNKQCIVFVNTRPLSQSTAKKLSDLTEEALSEQQKKRLQKAANAIRHCLESPTEQCELLAKLVEKGAAFHNAGLLEKQRHVVEEAFKKNLVKVICSTPSLSAGVNLPAFRVVIPSLYRYGETGSERISVSDYRQMAGRAGRPRYDDRGESVLIARTQTESDELFETYVNGDLENVESRLGVEPVLRSHLLAAISTQFVFDLESLHEFFSKTFYAFQFRQMDSLMAKLVDVLGELVEMGFVEKKEKKFEATSIGKRVSELYLDPFSAHEILVSLRNKAAFSAFSYLFVAASSAELSPYISVPKKLEPDAWERLQQSEAELPVDLKQRLYSDPLLLRKFFTAELLESWISEKPEPVLVDQFGVQPGILRAKLLNADWLVYCLEELSKLINENRHVPGLTKLRLRLKHGVKEELLILTQLRGIGRVRARRLWNSNVRSIADVKKIDIADLGRLIGDETAKKVKQQLGL